MSLVTLFLYLVGIALVLYGLYGVVHFIYFLWMLGVMALDKIILSADAPRRQAIEEERKQQLEAEAAEEARIGGILALRFLAQKLAQSPSATLESAHREFMATELLAGYEALAQLVGLSDFYTYDAYQWEMEGEDEALKKYVWKFHRMHQRLDELVRLHGSKKLLRDIPEVAETATALAMVNPLQQHEV